MNQLLAHQISSITNNFYPGPNSSVSNGNAFHSTIDDFINNFQVHPAFKYLHSIYTPILPKNTHHNSSIPHTELSLAELCQSVAIGDLSMCNFDHTNYKNLAMTMQFKGNISLKYLGASLSALKYTGLIQFVDWTPSGFKCFLINRPPVNLKDDEMLLCDK
jgi:tubulin alpha